VPHVLALVAATVATLALLVVAGLSIFVAGLAFRMNSTVAPRPRTRDVQAQESARDSFPYAKRSCIAGGLFTRRRRSSLLSGKMSMRRLLVRSDPEARKIVDKLQKHRALSRASLLGLHPKR
jgi:hypothetical protein